MFTDLMPETHKAAVRRKLQNAIAERQRIEARKAELMTDESLSAAIEKYREAERRHKAAAAERLQAHRQQCEADAAELAALARAKRTHAAAIELNKLQTEAGRLDRDIGVACRENDIDPSTLEGEQ